MINQPPSKILVACADDHQLVRRGIIDLISVFGGFEVIIEASQGEELIEKLNKTDLLPHVCILDFCMPVKDGLETMKEIKKRWPSIKILFLSIISGEEIAIRMLKYGANGYLCKNCSANMLKDALLSVHNSNYYHSELSVNIITRKSISSKGQCDISDKEVHFLKLCCEELTYKEIAEIMKLSVRTIEGYRDGLFVKLNISTRTGLVMYAIRTGIVMIF